MRKKNDKERGAAVVIALMVLALLTIMAMGALFTATRAIEMSGADQQNMKAFYVADAGMNRTIIALLDHYTSFRSFRTGGTNWALDLNGDGNPSSSELTPISGGTVSWSGLNKPTLNQWLNAQNTYRVATFDTASSCFGRMMGGRCYGHYYEVRLARAGRGVRVLSLARFNDDADDTNDRIDAAIEYVVTIITGSICDNALFGASSSVGHRIVGNVNVHGGVTVLCDNENFTANDVGYEVGGNAGIFDNWEGGSGQSLDSTMRSRMDPLYTDESGRETLDAKVLIQTCNMRNNSGAFQIGTSSAPVDTVIVDGGFTGSHTNPDTFIYADNPVLTGEGQFANYVGNAMPEFPLLHDENGNLANNDLGRSIAAQIPGHDLASANPNWCNLGNSTPNLSFGAPGCTCVDGGTSTCDICFFDNGNKLVVNTDTVFDLSGCATASIRDVTYKGKATMYYGDTNIAVDGNLMVADGESFPSTSVVGFLTAGQINIGSTAQAKMMGLFYAQDRITVSKQTQLAGIVITDEFSVGNQVPDFFQVPDLDQNAPAGFEEICGGNERLATGGWRLVY